MAKIKVPVFWMVSATMEIESDNLEKAIRIALEAPLPENGEYIPESMRVDCDLMREMNSPEIG